MYSLMNSKGRIVISKLGVTECFDTCLDAQSADSKVTIDIQLNVSEQRARFYVPGHKEPRFCSSSFVDCTRACNAKVSEPRYDLRRELPGQLQIQSGPVQPLPLASTVRAPTQTRRGTTTGQGLGEDLENVIKLEPIDNQMVDCVQALEGGDAGGASHELPDNGALTMARGAGSHCYERNAQSDEESNGRQNRVAQGKPLWSDAENLGDDGGHAETSGRPIVQSPVEEPFDEESFQPEFPAFIFFAS